MRRGWQELARALLAGLAINSLYWLSHSGSPTAPSNLHEAAALHFVRSGDVDTHWRSYTQCPNGKVLTFRPLEGLLYPTCGDVAVWESRTPRPTTTVMLQNNSSLLMAVRQRPPGAGMLDFPGGFIRSGESVLQGASRELEEEFGLRGSICEMFNEGTLTHCTRSIMSLMH